MIEMLMKKVLFFIAAALCVASCSNFTGDPQYPENEMPYIFSEYEDDVTAYVGVEQEIRVYVSPNDGSVSCRWLLDGEQISDKITATVKVDEMGAYSLKFIAERNGNQNSRDYTLKVYELAQEE